MMEILRGSPALSAFRINKLLARFQAANLQVHNIYAEYVHFADLNAPLNDSEQAQLLPVCCNTARRLAAIRRRVNSCWSHRVLVPSPLVFKSNGYRPQLRPATG